MSILERVFHKWYNICMNVGYELTIEQSQKLMLTPELIQAIQILQFNIQELNEFVQNELLENPLLEMEGERDTNPESDDIDIDQLREMVSDSTNYSEGLGQWDGNDTEDFSFEKYVSFKYSLIEHLLSQLQFSGLPEEQAEIGRFLIHNIDDNGYLSVSTKKVAEIMRADVKLVKDTLGVIQTFDPPGVGARSLAESLCIQLRKRDKLDDITKQVLSEHLDNLASNKMACIAKSLGTTTEKIQEIADLIKTLEPKPGRGYDSDSTVRYVIPDVVIEKQGAEYEVRIHNGGMPTLMVSSYYDDIKGNVPEDPELQKYLNDRMNSALWLIKSIEQRTQTIQKVAEAIVSYQSEYFDKGERYLKPLTLKQIADSVGVHESTVSRAINGKYMQTNRGVLEMKYFFTSGVLSDEGAGISSNSVKSMIREIVDKENPKKPYSDQAISEMLGKEGLLISRRTVAKYRDNMGIGSSSQRKRF